MDYIKETKIFVEKIKHLKEYTDYQNCKNVIESNPQLLEKVSEYKKKSFNIHIEYGDGSFECYENMLKLNKEYNEIIEQPEVNKFLEAENKLAKVIEEVYNLIAKEIDFNISFIE
ncbi:YlbF family regulator [Vallitalea guaymasensis]|uniref:YlbF family regulator n=1 Tax=Vallitalea guaymasensis TaxID=1185412 RepID=UPI000DE4B8E1|nr:YlbF family regulator [Vallitalea guaymasensis]